MELLFKQINTLDQLTHGNIRTFSRTRQLERNQKAKDEVREAMLELFDRRWNKRGLIISSQYPFDQWYEYIGGRGDQRDAMMDRIANGSHRLELKGPSMREKREKVMK